MIEDHWNGNICRCAVQSCILKSRFRCLDGNGEVVMLYRSSKVCQIMVFCCISNTRALGTGRRDEESQYANCIEHKFFGCAYIVWFAFVSLVNWVVKQCRHVWANKQRFSGHNIYNSPRRVENVYKSTSARLSQQNILRSPDRKKNAICHSCFQQV